MTPTTGTSPSRGLLDTGVLIASETGRPIRVDPIPTETAVCVVTIAELQAGVLAARDTATRSRRLATLASISDLAPLVIDVEAARHWALMRAHLAEAGLRINVNDLWIAAVAAANGLPVVTQDAAFDALEAIGGPAVIRV